MSNPSSKGEKAEVRDAGGRFAPGHKGGPGNPLARNVQHYRRLLMEAVSDDDFVSVIKKLVADAIAGDKDARQLLIERLCGKAEPVEPAGDAMFDRVIRVRPVKVLLPPGAIPADPNELPQMEN